MASLDDLKKTFFDECDEAMQQIEIGLTDIRSGEGNDETINAVFRGVHSVKGGAGIFGFEQLVGFAHVFETVLDGLRNGSLTATPDNLDVLLSASDVLSDLVQMSRGGEAIAAGFGADVRSALEHIIEQGGGAADDGDIAPAEFDGLDFMPVAVNLDDLGADDVPAGDGSHVYKIVFRPKPEMLKKANEPLYVLRELRKLGEAEIVANCDDLPALNDIETDAPYLWWTATLRTQEKRASLDEVFEFVMGDCELSIEDLTPPPVAAEPASPAPVPYAAAMNEVGALPVIEAPPVAPAMPAPKAEAKPNMAKSEGESGGGAGRGKPAATTTRIELERIDRVVNMVGELVISQAMLGQIVQDLPESTSMRLVQILDEVAHHTRELKDSVMSMRAQPVGSVFQRMPRLVREVAAKTHKKVRLETHGETTEVDRSIIERLGDPLTHIIRNSVDHGIETPSARIAAGKPEEGVVRLAAEHRGGRIVIEIKDDGAGINSERVLKIAREKGLVGADAQLTEDEINNLIMMPGFSTAETISDISGRGVGMDVVRSNIQDLGGRITLKSARGQGMTIQLALPLTLAVMDGMVIKVGTQTYVMPLSAIVECLRPSRGEINALIGTHGMLQLRGEFVPIILLSDLLGVDAASGANTERVVIVTDNGDGSRIGLVVDELLGHQQVVIKSIEESYGAVPGIAAATILGNGRVAFILDVEKLADLAAQTPITNHATTRAAQPALN
ncbi:chemotaxis protein CheA [Undibacter mobilis]|uniref:Chemotaxis protein CheA n=1 Tax=Undibacter mobilis TaxID=2292256 RepID=A0A371B7Z7_9BRAD|nr:chemotaxis protein CheA [Undibacter mobilis]RDV03501.1 chemotaxis protein CheA [Undibacter mobilis]